MLAIRFSRGLRGQTLPILHNFIEIVGLRFRDEF